MGEVAGLEARWKRRTARISPGPSNFEETRRGENVARANESTRARTKIGEVEMRMQREGKKRERESELSIVE